MPAVCQDVVHIKMFQNTTSKDVFLNLTAFTIQGNWSIITGLVLFSLLEYGCDIGTPPVFKYSSCIKALLKYDGEVWCNDMASSFSILAGSRSGPQALAGLSFSSSLPTPCLMTLVAVPSFEHPIV